MEIGQEVEPVPPSSVDAAVSMIRQYARDHNLTPQDVVDIFNAGIGQRAMNLRAG